MKKCLLAFSFLITMVNCNNKKDILNRDIINSVVQNDTLIYTTFSKQIVLENLNNGRGIFRRTIEDNIYYPLVLNGDRLYFSQSDFKFVCFDLKLKKIVWEIKTEKPVKSISVYDKNIFLNIKSQGFKIIDMENGNQKGELPFVYSIKCTQPDLSPYPIAFLENAFFLGNWNCNSISKFDINKGSFIKSISFEDGFIYLQEIGENLFVGVTNYKENNGSINLVNSELQTLFSTQVKYEERMKPVIWNEKVIYYTFDNSIYIFDIITHSNIKIFQLPKEDDISGSKIILSDDKLFFHTSNFEILQYDLINSKLSKLGKLEDRKLDNIYFKNGKIELIR